MNDISFKARIVLTSPSGFHRAKMRVPAMNHINYPWTSAEARVAKCVATSNVSDCAYAEIDDSEKIAAGHFDPLNLLNRTFSNIVRFFDEKRGLLNQEYLQATVIGGKAPCIAGEDSYKQFDKIVNYFASKGIPTRIFKGGMGEKHICHFADKDEIVIGADVVNKFDPYERISAEDAFKRVFNEIKILPEDELIFQKTWL